MVIARPATPATARDEGRRMIGSGFGRSEPSSIARTASSVRENTRYRSNRRRRWLSMVFSERREESAASALDAPAPIRVITAISRSEGLRGADRTDLTAAAVNAVPPAATVRMASIISTTSAVLTT